MVAEMVGVSHARIDRVRELLERAPELAKADWSIEGTTVRFDAWRA
jgi:hypothetical protein